MTQAKKQTTKESAKRIVKNVKSQPTVQTANAAGGKGEGRKSTTKKADVKTAAIEQKVAKQDGVNLLIDVYGIDRKVSGKVSLPHVIFGEKVNKQLLAQAVRVYLANKRQGTVSTKTRGEVDGSTRKIYRQKGTGRARHGSVRAPIFVHGGVVHGPKPRDYSLNLPKKMRRKALFSALSAKLQDGQIKVVAGFEKLEPKTKAFISAITPFQFDKKSTVLVILPGTVENVQRAASNVAGVTLRAARQLNALDVLRAKHLLLLKDAIAEMEKTFVEKV